MLLRTLTCAALLTLGLVLLPAVATYAGNTSSYEAAKGENRANAGLHQRRAAFRDQILNQNAENGSSMSKISPAAGEVKAQKASKDNQ